MDIDPLTGKAAAAVAHSTYPINIFEGTVRSSKTIASLLAWCRYVRTAPPGMLLLTGRTERTVVNNVVQPLMDMLGPSRVQLNRGAGAVTILGRPHVVVGANTEAARTKIQGATFAGAYADEVSTLPETYFNMLFSRLSVAGARMWGTSNPEGPVHWLKTKWLDRAALWIDRDGVHHHGGPDALDLLRVSFQLSDNTYLTRTNPAYIERILATYKGLWRRRYLLGEWVAAEGAVYDGWDPDTHVIAHADLPEMVRVLALGVDHGMTNATDAVLLGLGVDRCLYAMDEWRAGRRVDGGALTVQQQSAALRGWLGGRPVPEWVVVDPAAAAFKVQLHHDGLRNLGDADNDVRFGISTVASLLGSGRLRVSERCTWLIEEFPSYVWDDKAAERGEDKPVKVADHGLDSLRYAVATTEAMWRPYLDDEPGRW